MLKRFAIAWLTILFVMTALISVGATFFWRYPLELLTHFRVYYFLLSLFIVIGVSWYQLSERRSPVLLLLSVALLGFNSSWIIPWYHPNSHQGQGDSIRVVTFNINTQNQEIQAVADTLRQQKPDIATIIETTLEAKEQLSENLADILPFAYRTSGGGLAILSRFPLINPQSKIFPGGTILLASFQVGEKPVQLIAAHPLVPVKPSFFHQRNTLLAEITAYIQSQPDKNLIFLGDMNLTPWSPYYRRLVNQTRMHNTRLGFGVEPSWIEPATHVHLPSWLTMALKIPIDHIFVSNDIKVANCQTLKAANSDHRLLLSDLILS